MYRTVTRHAPDVIAAEIHEHAMLSQLLRVAAQRRGQCLVLGGRGSSWARTPDWPHGHFVPPDAHPDFGRGAPESHVIEGEIEKKGGGIQRPPGAIKPQRIDGAVYDPAGR